MIVSIVAFDLFYCTQNKIITESNQDNSDLLNRDMNEVKAVKPAIYIGIALQGTIPTKQEKTNGTSDNSTCHRSSSIMSTKHCDGVCYYAVYSHDGFYSLDCCIKNCQTTQDFNKSVYDEICKFQQDYKVVIVAYDDRVPLKASFLSTLWLQNDILPIGVSMSNTVNGASLEEMACSAVRKSLHFMAPAASIPTICSVAVGYRNQVEVDGNGHISLVTLDNYKTMLHEREYAELLLLSQWAIDTKLKVMFINSTPRGGGVALMRHAMIRLFKLLGVDVSWFVMKPDPKIFEVTKIKFHNVLQGVLDTRLTEVDKVLYETWCTKNVTSQWIDVPIKDSSIIVIDDPQPVGIVNIVKKKFPSKKIIYRNHIQIDYNMVDTYGTAQNETFSYLYDSFIKNCDVVVNHPVELPQKLLHHPQRYVMPATTDPFDGLNKPMTDNDKEYYYVYFERLCRETLQPVPSLRSRWITQIARFDPSKGILDVIKAFKDIAPKHLDTHLVITGHGSIDDPEGTKIYHQIKAIVSFLHDDIRARVTILRVPPSDQLLNFILTQSTIAIQLSHKEGFEVKVTEAIMKGIPVIAYRTGGIPQQIEDEITGFLITPRDVDDVVSKLDCLLSDKELYNEIKKNCMSSFDIYSKYLTPFNCLRWLRLWKNMN